MYRIRFHGRGGQGIKTANQILGSAFFLQGFEVQDAPRYGAERRGAPIFAYLRASRAPIHERGDITRPDLVVVADESLIPVPASGVLQGVSAHTVLLINSADAGELWKSRLNLEGPVIALAVPAGGMEHPELPYPYYIGAACAGAAARLTGALAREHLAQSIREELARYGPATVEKNLEHALSAFDGMGAEAGRVTEGAEISALDYRRPEWIELPLEDARISAPNIHAGATSELARTGVWRSFRPVIDYGLCNRCSWVCSTLCPDGAIRVEPDHLPRIEYDQCKGCLICITVCPPHAISAVPEREARSTEGTP